MVPGVGVLGTSSGPNGMGVSGAGCSPRGVGLRDG